MIHTHPEDEPDKPDETGLPDETKTADETEAADAGGGETPTEPQPPAPEEQIAALNDQILRLLAELENTRRRAERDHADALKYGAMALARDIVGAVDDLQRGLQAINQAVNKASNDMPPEEQNDTLTMLLEGVQATERNLLAGLSRHKVTPINPKGEKFDPNLHEALFETPDSGQPNGTIIEVVETGYMIGERLLRPAKVGIAKAKE